ncbi:TQXA domain protein [Saccharomonospora piscinae]|uniref:TQXA domain protein n=1 Tax=Saccharomonospora piscinae TaxID=687388 RepID=A0A1V9A145_SACPI|nr:thioester domain-containing protein [Saccharomonospora piscinae]OQO90743.1 TQXA domain protein [Saccharomonospora piscinae]
MNSRRTFARLGAFAGATALALSLGSVPAAADEGKADFAEGGTSGYRVNVNGGFQKTTLFALDHNGSSLRAYCVEISVNVDENRSLFETPWNEFPNPDSPFHANRDHINWVLHHGFPVQDLGALEQTLTEQGAELHDGLNKREAVAATQAAVWHYSDGKDIDREDPVRSDDPGADADVLALYDYLTGESNVGVSEPNASLEIGPEHATGEAGERIGPFTVTTGGQIDELATNVPEGVTVTDAEGNELTAGDITDGTELYLDVPAELAEGSGEFALSATAQLPTGRLFVSEGYDRKPAQSLILASSEDTKLSAMAGAEWTAAPAPTTPEEPTETTPTAPGTTESQPAPVETSQPSVTPQANSDDLAQTGFSALTPLLIGVGLVGAGAGAIFLQRRRKSA